MNRTLSLILVTLVSVTAQAQRQEDPAAKPIIAKAIATIKDLKSIRYTMEDSSKPDMRATVYLEQAKVPTPGPLTGKYWANVETDLGGGKKERVKYSFDGKIFRYLPAGGDKVEALDTPSGAEIAQLIPFEIAIFPINLLTFSLEDVIKTKYLKTGTYGGRECDLIEITREVKDPLGETMVFTIRWGIDRKTSLPVYFENDRGTKKTVITLELNPARNDALFRLAPAEILIEKNDALAKGLLPVGQPAPDFNVKDSRGRSLRLADYRGKLLLIDFWATWCMPCIRAMPELKKIHDRYKGRGLSVVSMAVSNPDGDPAGYMKARGYDWTSVPVGDSAGASYKAGLIPTLYLIGKDGRILFRVSGVQPGTPQELDTLIRKHLG